MFVDLTACELMCYSRVGDRSRAFYFFIEFGPTKFQWSQHRTSPTFIRIPAGAVCAATAFCEFVAGAGDTLYLVGGGWL